MLTFLSLITFTKDEDELLCGFLRCPPLDDLCFTLFEVFMDSVSVLVLAAQGIDGREKEVCPLSGGRDLELEVSVEGQERERECGRQREERE